MAQEKMVQCSDVGAFGTQHALGILHLVHFSSNFFACMEMKGFYQIISEC